MGSLDKVVFHGRSVASQDYVVRDVVGDLASVVEECSAAGAWIQVGSRLVQHGGVV
jgi:hypothetical protein